MTTQRYLLLLVNSNSNPAVVHRITSIASLLKEHPDWHGLFIDDALSKDHYRLLETSLANLALDRILMIKNDFPQGPGGNRKIGFRYAIQNHFTGIAVCDRDTVYTAPILKSLQNAMEAHGHTGCALGSDGRRNLLRAQVFRLQNRLSRLSLKNWETPYRIYRTSALEQIAFELNTNERPFETELLLQLGGQGIPIIEFQLPGAVDSANAYGLRDARQSLKACIRFALQRLNLFYDFRFHPESIFPLKGSARVAHPYGEKFSSDSPHSFVCRHSSLIPQGSKVLDIGCAGGYVGRALTESKACKIVGVDRLDPEDIREPCIEYHQIDLEKDTPKLCQLIENGDFDVILMLDVLEHLAVPERFLLMLYRIPYRKKPLFIFSTGNVAFCVIRLMLLAGYFNYGEKGILDITHKRLFSWKTFQNLFDQTGFSIREKRSFPAPYSLMHLPPWMCRTLERINRFLIRIRPSLFSYQMLVITTPFTSPEQYLSDRFTEKKAHKQIQDDAGRSAPSQI